MAKASKGIKKSVADLLKIREKHISDAENVHKQIKEVAREEAQEIWADIKKQFGRLEDKFNSLEMTEELKGFINDKLEDISAIKELIEEKKAEKKAEKKTRKPKKPDARSTKTFLYWNPDNHKQGWSGKGKKPDWVKVDLSEIENHPRYIHQRHPRYDELVPERKHHELTPM